MDASTHVGHAHAAHETHHHEVGFWRGYIFSTDHKVIGIQYGVTALCFLLFGFILMMLMRWQLAYPGQPIPIIGTFLGSVLGDTAVSNGVMQPDLYNAFGAMHGTIMVFLAIVPLAFAAFGNYVVPLQIGAVDMAFPRVNMVSYQCYFMGGVIMFASFFVPGGAARSGWTSYSPLATLAHPELVNGQTFWIIGMVFLITSSLLGAINFIATIIQLRAPGMTWMRLPFFVWAQFVTAFLLVLAFPPLEAAAVMQLADNLLGTSFFLPSGLLVSGQPPDVSGGGSPLWQHLFWFLGHPEVYVLILPAMGIVAEIIANNTRKPIWGYKSLVYSILAIGFLSFIVWAHHMYLTGMGTKISTFFQTTTMIISIPSVIILTCLFISLWGGSIRFNTPMLFALAFLPMFGIGGLTGLPLGFNFSDLHLHDTYYVIAHFHYVVAPGTIFGLFAGIYYWYPKITGRMMNEFWGKVHFALSLILMNLVFQPMFAQGFAGMNRRLYDGGATYANTPEVVGLPASSITTNEAISHAAWLLGVAQLPFIINFFWSIRRGKKVTSDNPWGATTLEWQTPTPPPHGNFDRPMEAHRGPYEYSVPGHDKDFTPERTRETQEALTMDIPYTVKPRPDTGLFNAKVGIWLFLASEVMLFGGLFSSYIFLRVGSDDSAWPHGLLNIPIGTFNTAVLITSSVTVVLSWAALKLGNFKKFRMYQAVTILCALGFLGIKTFEYKDKFTHYEVWKKDGTRLTGHIEGSPWFWDMKTVQQKGLQELNFEVDSHHYAAPKVKDAGATGGGEHGGGHEKIKIPVSEIRRLSAFVPGHSTYFGIYFTLTALHALHVFGGALVIAFLWGPGAKMWRTEPERYTNRIEISGLFWHFVDLVWIFLFPILYLL